jgi:hypothetical protein
MMDLIAKLQGVTKCAEGWGAKCPAHKDQQASLSVAHRNGKWLLNCHAGCTAAAICAAISIELKDLFDPPRKGKSERSPEQIFADASPIGQTLPYFPARGLDAGAFPTRPALIAAATDGAGAMPAIQRIYLTSDRKAKACKPMSLGRIKGLAIRLGPPTETLYLAEGFEDAATAQQANGATAWAALGASNIPNVILPEATTGVVLLGQNDKDNPDRHDPTFARYAAQATRKFSAKGKQVRVVWRPAGVKDINDLVRGKTGEDLAKGYVQARTMLESAQDQQAPAAPQSSATVVIAFCAHVWLLLIGHRRG